MAKAKDPELEHDEDEVILEKPVTRAPRMTVEKQFERNRQIVEEKLAGVPIEQIAAKHNLTGRRVRGILTAWRAANPPLRTKDPMEIVDEMIDQYLDTIRQLSAEAADTTNQAAARVGAHNTKLRAIRDMAELLQATGVLPHDLGEMSLVIDGRIAAERLYAIFERRGMPDDFYDEVAEAFGGPPAGTNPSLN